MLLYDRTVRWRFREKRHSDQPGFNHSSRKVTLTSHRTLHMFNELTSPCIAGQRVEVNNTSVRIVFLTAHTTSLVIMAAYSAFLISSLAVQPRELPFRDLQGLLNDGSYKLGIVDRTSTINIFDVRRMSLLSHIGLLPSC
jgi:hypothetical protein